MGVPRSLGAQENSYWGDASALPRQRMTGSRDIIRETRESYLHSSAVPLSCCWGSGVSMWRKVGNKNKQNPEVPLARVVKAHHCHCPTPAWRRAPGFRGKAWAEPATLLSEAFERTAEPPLLRLVRFCPDQMATAEATPTPVHLVSPGQDLGEQLLPFMAPFPPRGHISDKPSLLSFLCPETTGSSFRRGLLSPRVHPSKPALPTFPPLSARLGPCLGPWICL